MKSENEELRNAREVAEKNYHVVMNNNNALQIKLENIGNYITYTTNNSYFVEIFF